MAIEGMVRQQMLHRLYAEHHGWLNGWLRRQLGCNQRAADLAQGLLINHWRRRQIEQAYLDALALQPEPVAPSPESQALIVETLLQVDAMLAQLPAKVRSAFLMSQLQGMTYAAIAIELGVSERMVKKYMAQGMLHCLLLVAED